MQYLHDIERSRASRLLSAMYTVFLVLGGPQSLRFRWRCPLLHNRAFGGSALFTCWPHSRGKFVAVYGIHESYRVPSLVVALMLLAVSIEESIVLDLMETQVAILVRVVSRLLDALLIGAASAGKPLHSPVAHWLASLSGFRHCFEWERVCS